MKTDKELADELDARKRIERHGYTRVPCSNPKCTEHRIQGYCYCCGNKGYTWKAPMMRLSGFTGR